MTEENLQKESEINTIEEMLLSLCDHDNYYVIRMLKNELEQLKKTLNDDSNLRKLELLKTRIEQLEKGLTVYSNYFCEECIYLLMNIKRKER